MIDIHSQMLPGIDDGPQQLEDAVAIALAYVADYVTHVVVTPHVYPGRYDDVRRSITAEYTRFAAAIARLGVPLQLSFTGEVRLTPEVLDLQTHGELPFLDSADSTLKTLLLELPDGQVPLGADQFIGLLRRQGIPPAVAHPERNRGVMERLDRMRPFVETGCQKHLTAGSLLGEFGAKAQNTAQTQLDAGSAHVVASDAHSLHRRPPRMRAARQWLAEHYGEAATTQLTLTGPARLCGMQSGAKVLHEPGRPMNELAAERSRRGRRSRRSAQVRIEMSRPRALWPLSAVYLLADLWLLPESWRQLCADLATGPSRDSSTRLGTPRPLTTEEEWHQALDALGRSVAIAPDNADSQADLGALYGSASLRADIGPEQRTVYALSARPREQAATRLRPTEPRGWADLARTLLTAHSLGDEYIGAWNLT